MPNHLYDGLLSHHEANSDILVEQAARKVISYADFARLASKMANLLLRSGLRPNDRVAVQAEKSPEVLALYIATIQAGGVFLPLNPAFTIAESSFFIQDANPRIFVCDPKAYDQVCALTASCNATVMTLDAGGRGSLMRRLDENDCVFKPVIREAHDLAALMYTSGTTGRPKGAMVTHDNLLSNALALVDCWRICPSDILIHALPIFHTHGLFVAVNTILIAGAKILFLPKFDTEAIIYNCSAATMLMGVPTFYTRLLAHPDLNYRRMANMRLFISGSAPLRPETLAAFATRTGHIILERYGMTETGMITSNPVNGERRVNSVGPKLADIEVRITDTDSGVKLPPNSLGMIEVRGPNVCVGYWNKSGKSGSDFLKDGYFVTGDLGEISEDGYLSIVGRAKDLIITGGYNVYPKEIEDIVYELNGIKEAAIFGVVDEEYGEIVVAALVAEDDWTLDLEAVKSRVAASLARFKHPRYYQFLNSLPRNTMGKIQKNVLQSNFSAALSQGQCIKA